MAKRKPKSALPEGLEWLKTNSLDPKQVEGRLVAALRDWDEASWWPMFNVARLLFAVAPQSARKEAARLMKGRDIEEGSTEDDAPWLAVALALGDFDVREANDSGAIGPLPGDMSTNSVALEVGDWLASRVAELTPPQATKWLEVSRSTALRDAAAKAPKLSSLSAALAEKGATVTPAKRKLMPPLAQLAAQATAKKALRGEAARDLAERLVPELVRDAKQWSGCMPWRWPTPLNEDLLDVTLRVRAGQLAIALPESAGAVLHEVARKLGSSLVAEAIHAELALRGWFEPTGAEHFMESKLLTLASLMPAEFNDAVGRRAQRDGFFRGLFLSSPLASHRALRSAAEKARAASRPR